MIGRRKTLLLAIISIGVITLSSCGLQDDKAGYHFRMTVEVETPQGMKTGSSVMAVHAVVKTIRLMAEERAGGAGLQGQAVQIDLPDGPVFALLAGEKEGMLLPVAVTTALSSICPTLERDWNEQFIACVHKLEDAKEGEVKAELPRKDWPIMVRFRNINDPMTA